MTKDKERDDALIAEAISGFPGNAFTAQMLAQAVLRLERSGWQPKPDRAEVLARDVLLAWSGYQQLTDEEAGSEEFAKACRFTQTALDELRAEWEAERPAVVVPNEEQIKQMVTRFLGWRLPEDFRPDDGISFEPEFNKEWNASQGKPPQRRTPTGTNLFSYTQAEAMVRYMIDGAKGGA